MDVDWKIFQGFFIEIEDRFHPIFVDIRQLNIFHIVSRGKCLLDFLQKFL